MKGMMRRDLALLSINLRFYLIFIVVMAFITAKSGISASFMNLYVMIFASSSIMGLFNYDEVGHWQSYLAATQGGRKIQVTARYGTTLAIWALITAVQLLLALLTEESEVSMALLFSGMFLLYVAILLPVNYKFGSKSRLVMIILIAAVAGVIGAGGGILLVSGTASPGGSVGPLPLFLLALGAAALALSYRISLGIMGRKEL